MSIILFLVGFFSFLGNLIGGYVCDRIGFIKALLLGTCLQLATAICILLSKNSLIMNAILVLLWMANEWFIGLRINSGIAIMTNNKSNANISLNSSGVQFGQAISASVAAAI